MFRHLRVKFSNNKGFTLIEMMIAIVLIMVSMMAYLSAMVTAIQTSNNNEFRDVSTRIANQTGESLLALPFSDSELTLGNHSRIANDSTQGNKGLPDTTQVVRNSQQSYSISWIVTPQSLDAIQILITVRNTNNNKIYNLVVFKQRTI